MRNKRTIYSVPLCFVLNIILVYIIYMACRLMFLLNNWGLFATD